MHHFFTQHRLLIGLGARMHAHMERNGIPASLIILDIDYFKTINDRLGHIAGDVVLKDLCTLTRTVLRPGDHVARWGGDEVCIAVEGSASDAQIITKRLQAALAERHS